MFAHIHENETQDFKRIGAKFTSQIGGNNMSHIKKVILVEDNPADIELTKLAFKNQTIPSEVVPCSDGNALIHLLHHVKLTDVGYILLDLNLPKLSGIEILNIIAKDPEWHKLPVIVFTSSTDAREVSACYEAGANAYVLKPLDFNDYNNTIRAIHEFWCGVNLIP
jgi:two-component system response regulator